jgi:RsiW-degrading membrane proteinase PrsW (M82 family)
MQHALPLLPVVLPLIFWGAYHYHKDRHLPEPVGNLALCFVLGLVAAALSKGMYMALEPFGWRLDAVALAETNGGALFLYAILAIGPIEELSKLLPFVLIVVHFKAFDEPLDGLVYASFIALGYAAVENYLYLDFLTGAESVARGFAGPVVHILFASIWAHWITRAWLAERRLIGPAFAGFVVAAFLHGIYDFLVLRQPVAALPIAATLIGVIWVWRLYLMRRLHEDAVENTGGPQAGS